VGTSDQVYASTTYPGGQGATLLTSKTIAYDGNDVVVQGSSVASGATCFRRTLVSGDFDVWTTQSSSASQVGGGGSACAGLIWYPGASLFIASYALNTNTSIDTSPDGITFTSKTLPNTDFRGPMATNGVTIVCLSGSSANTCLSSVDANTWVVRTLPFTDTWNDVCYSPKLGLFCAISNTGRVATSPDGITWTSTGATFPPTYSVATQLLSVRDLAGMLIATFATTTSLSFARKGVLASFDAGASWRTLVGAGSDAVGLATSASQCVWANGSFMFFSNNSTL
jgi:hypothetical protein